MRKHGIFLCNENPYGLFYHIYSGDIYRCNSSFYRTVFCKYFSLTDSKHKEKLHDTASFFVIIPENKAVGNHEIPLAIYERMCYNVRRKGGEIMEQKVFPVDVISMCSASGEIRPLRLRMEDEQHQLLRIDIEEIISSKEIQYVGIEATVYLCRATVRERKWLFELKYTIRSHTWSLLRKVY